jgi:hypothetical protein
MLKELRQALADTLGDGLAGVALVVPYKPGFIEWPTQSPVVVFLRPDPGEYVSPWLTFSQSGRGTVNLEVVATIPYTDNAADPGPDFDALDDIVDPISGSRSIFAALIGTDGGPVALDLASGNQASVQVASAPVQGAQLVQDADNALVRYEVVVPVQVIVQRS